MKNIALKFVYQNKLREDVKKEYQETANWYIIQFPCVSNDPHEETNDILVFEKHSWKLKTFNALQREKWFL